MLHTWTDDIFKQIDEKVGKSYDFNVQDMLAYNQNVNYMTKTAM